jgi:hypothetical protein
MSLTVAALIDRIGDHLTATLPTSPDSARWTRSRFLPPQLGQDTEAKMARAWSVWAPASARLPPAERQKLSEGTHVETTVEVGFSRPLRADGTAADFQAALAEEDVLRLACAGITRTSLPRFTLTGSTRTVSGDNRTLITVLTWTAAHTIPLQ